MEQRRAIKKQIKYSPLQKLLFAVVLFVFAFSMFRVASVIAAEETFSIAEAKITSKSETVEVKSFTFEGCKITKTITYHKVGDNVVYAVTIMNNDSKDYVIKSISDDNENEYLSYEYDSYEGTKIESKGKFVFVVTEKYAKEVEDINSRIQSFSVNFKFTLEDEEGNESEIVIPSVTPSQKPKTGDEIGPYMVSAVLALIVMLILASKKGTVKVSVKTPKAKEEKVKVARIEKHSAKHAGKGFKVLSMLLILALLIPTVSKAVSSQALMLTFENVIELKDKLSISYEIDGEEHEITVDYGDTIGEIEVPEKEGYGFDGWEDEDGNPFDPETTPITDDITITPKYTAINYTITYNELTDDEKAGYETLYNIESNTINISDPVREGYTFTGWSGTGLTGEDNKNISIPTGSTGDKVFEAHFAKETYTIILDLEGGEGTTEVTREYKDPIGELPEPEREGYNFSGWTDDEGNEVTEDTEVTGPMEIHANWSAINYTITYNELTDDEKAGYETSYNIESNTINISDPVREGYTFTGWSGTGLTGEDNKNISIPTGSTGDKVFEAHFTPIEYRISYTDVPDDEMAYYQYPTSYTIEDYFYYYNPHRNGYSFAGWSGTGIEGTTYFFEILEGSTGDKEITANWTPVEYTITYNGLTPSDWDTFESAEKYTIEQSVTLGTPANRVDGDGDVTERFIGWNDGTSTSLNVTIPVGTTGEKVYTAVWQTVAPDEYIITYDLVLDQVVVDNPTIYTKLTDTITLNEPTREGFEFTGWSGTGLIGEANKTVIIPQGSKGDRSYTAHWKKNTYTITFEPTYGSLEGDPTMRRDYEDTLGTLPVPTREGYKFKGWYSKTYPNLPVNENTIVTGDMTLDASWEEIAYRIFFYSNIPGDGQYYEVVLTYTQNITFHDYQMSRDGYTQTRWTTNSDGTGTEYSMLEFGSGYSSVDGDRIDLYAQWQGNQYTIEYRYNYDMSHHIFNGPSGTSNYTPEECPLSISNATATGFTFDGWSTSEYGTFNTDYELPEGTWGYQTLYGHFTPINYHITYDYDGGEIPNGGSNTDTYTVEDTIYLIEPEKTGHTFQGWSVVGHDDTGWVDYINGNLYAEDITVKAHYTANTYTISFETYGGTHYSERHIQYGSPIGALETPTKTGYRFDGWYSDSSFETPVGDNEICSGDATFYANWSVINYTVSYDGLDEYQGPSLNNPTYYNVESDTLYISNPQDIYDNDGDLYKQFSGWLVNGSISYYAYEETIPHGSTGDITFTATWREVDPPTYYITYETHGFPTSPTSNPTFFNKKTETFTLSNPIGTGYIFDGWTGSNGDIPQTTVQVVKGTRQNLYFEAHMRPITYSIVFDANGGEGEQISETYTYHENGFLPQNPYTKEGYTFKEWNEAADGKSWGYEPGSNVLDKTSVDGEVITYYAIWTPNNYTITYNANSDGVTGSMQEQPATYDEAITLYKNIFEKLGFKFDSWNTETNGSGTRYEDEAEAINLVAEGIANLYAQWAVTPYTIIFDKNDENATGTMESMSVPYGETVNLNPLTYTYTDHKLKEWNTKADGTGTSYADEAEVKNLDIDGEITLYAQWRDVESIFAQGLSVNTKMKALAGNNLSNVTAVRQYTGTPDVSNFTVDNIVSSNTSPDPIYAWYDNGTIYYWSEDTHPALGNDAARMFEYFSNATVIEVGNFEVGNTSLLTRMFQYCNKVEELDIDDWDTSNVTHMGAVFDGCNNVTSLDITGWNTDKVTAMYYMFNDCNKLESIDLSSFNTEKVSDINTMFAGCKALTEIDLSSFDTQNVTNMGALFKGCSNLETISWGNNFDTSLVNNMGSMFNGCGSLAEVDLSGFNTEKVTNMREMFRGIGVTELDLSSFNTSKVNTMLGTFYGTNIENLILGDHFDTSNVENMFLMFAYSKKLETIDVSGFDTTKVTNMEQMFMRCEGLKTLDISNFDTSNVKEFQDMFSCCFELEILDLGQFSTASATHVGSLVSDDAKLKTIYVTSDFDDTYFKNNQESTFIRAYGVVGGAGTTYITESSQYAQIDGGPSNPGYFTNKDVLNIYYSPNGDNVTGTMQNQSTQANTDIQLNANQYTNLGYAFGGWNTEADGSGTHYDDEQIVNSYGSLFLKAQWGVTPYTVIFDKNADDATGTMSDISKAYGEHFNLPANQFVRSGYAFDGWNSKADGTGRHYDDEQSVVNLDIDGEVTLYAEWVEMTAVFKNSTAVRNKIKELVPEDKTIRKIKNAAECPDLDNTTYEIVSVDNSYYPIYMWFDENTETIYYWSEAEKEILNADSAGLFSGYTNVTEIDTANLDTSRVTSMERMFQSCPGLTELDLSTWNTENVTSMAGMFGNCTGLTELDLTNFNTGKVTNIAVMFQNCTGLTSLDVSTWNTSEVTNMKGVFGRETWGTYGCTNLTELDLRNWNTSKVTNMENMFYGCTNLKEVQTDKWDTSNVTKMCYMFANCSNLETLDATTLDLTNVTTTTAMFSECSKLQILDVEDWETGNVTAMNSMFAGCKSLYVLDPSGWDTSKVTTFANMFGGNSYNGAGCESLTVLDLSEWNTDSATNMSSMFTGCISLSSLDVSGFNTSNVTTMSSMFGGTQYKKGCESLTELDITNFITDNVTDMSNMFRGCFNLSEIDVSSFNTDKVTNMGGMFCSCKSMEVIDIDNFNTSNVTNMEYMFAACHNLTTIDLTNFDTKKVTNMGDMFQSCRSLVVLDLTSFETSTNTNMTRLFYDAQGLTTIYATEEFKHPGSAYCPFFNTSLIGGAGTRYSYEHMYIDYACIDDPANGHPGYFTDKSKLNVYYYPNGNDVTGTMENQSVQANTNLTLNTNQYIRLGYAYGGWNTKADGSGTHYADGQVVNGYGSLFLYAQWGITPYTVLFDKNSDEATGEMDSISKAYGEHFNLPENRFERRGYYLAGWNTKADGTGIHYDDEADVVNLDIDGEVTLYAEWAEKVAIFNQGVYVSPKIAALIADSESNNIAIKESLVEPDLSEMTSDNIVSYPTSPYPIYMWLDGETVYWWTEDIMPEMHSNSRELFANLPKVTSIETEKIDTKNAKDMRNLFYGTNISSVDLSTWDTSKVTTMGGMFSNSGVTTVDLSTLDTSSLTSINNMFTGATKLTSVNFGDSFDTSKVTTMSQIFWKCSSLESVEFGASFDTSNVKSMDSMFQQCTSLESIDFGPKFSTASATKMDRMFQQCSSLQAIDLRNFDTSKVTTMYCMFSGCNSVASLDFGTNFDVRRVKNMDLMFNGCRTIETLNLSGFKTEALTSMSQMFQGCTNLKTINFGNNFDTSRVESFGYLFYQCSNLESLDLSTWDTTNVTRTDVMFQDCPKLASITFGPNFKCKKVSNMSQMFQNCRELQNLDLSYFELDSAINMSAVFRGCSKLESVMFGNNVNTGNATNMAALFNGCAKLQTLDLSNFHFGNVTTMKEFCNGCSSLQSINFGNNVNTTELTDMSWMFYRCSGLTSIDMSKFNATNVQNTSIMFQDCTNLETIDLGSTFVTNSLTNTEQMFQGTSKLTTIYVTGFDTNSITRGDNMFRGCSVLAGGQGTRVTAEHLDHEYARIDGGESNPGYFTSRAAGQNNTNSTNSSNPSLNMMNSNSLNTVNPMVQSNNLTDDENEITDEEITNDDTTKESEDTEKSNLDDNKDDKSDDTDSDEIVDSNSQMNDND